MPDALPRSTPAEQGADPAAILRFLDAVEEDPAVEMHSLMVVRNGRVVAEGWWAPYSAGRPQLLYRLSTSSTPPAAASPRPEAFSDLAAPAVSPSAGSAADITDPRSRSTGARPVAAWPAATPARCWAR